MRHIKAPSSIIQQICCVIFLQNGRSGPGGHIDFYKKHEAETPEVVCLAVINNWFNNHGREEKKTSEELLTEKSPRETVYLFTLNVCFSSSLFYGL